MPGITLDVPLIAQARSMSCWYASAVMVSYYYEQGPRLALPDVWLSNEGLTQDQVKDFAKVENLSFLNSASHDFPTASLINTLGGFGPIWAGGRWFGVTHAIAITGVDSSGDDGGTVFFNDPDSGKAKSGSINFLNAKRMRGFMLVRNPASIPTRHRGRYEKWT